MKLLPHERQTAVWVKLVGHLEDQIALDQNKLEDDTLTKKRTTQLRARIRYARELLALGEPDPALVADDDESSA